MFFNRSRHTGHIVCRDRRVEATRKNDGCVSVRVSERQTEGREGRESAQKRGPGTKREKRVAVKL